MFDYRYVNNGGLASHGASAGPATIGVQQTFVARRRRRRSRAYARVLLPLDTARQSGVETGLELGGGLRRRGRRALWSSTAAWR